MIRREPTECSERIGKDGTRWVSPYPITDARLHELLAEYVRYRKPNGMIPEPQITLISALSELKFLREFIKKESQLGRVDVESEAEPRQP